MSEVKISGMSGNEKVLYTHDKVVSIAKELSSIIESFFEKEDDVFVGNEKFLVANRAMSLASYRWFNHFIKEFNPENKFPLGADDALTTGKGDSK